MSHRFVGICIDKKCEMQIEARVKPTNNLAAKFNALNEVENNITTK